MTKTVKIFLTIAVLLTSGIALITLTLFFAGSFFTTDRTNSRRGFVQLPLDRYSSNGERIFFTGTSRDGPAIDAQIEGMHHMPGRRTACAGCHGDDGQGGIVHMMMSSIEAPDIRWEHLTEDEHGEDHGEEHPAYTPELFKLAVTAGLDPSGEPLNWVMPRWDMTDEQLEDLIAFLQTLE